MVNKKKKWDKPNRLEWVVIIGIVVIILLILFGVLRGQGVQRESDMELEAQELEVVKETHLIKNQKGTLGNTTHDNTLDTISGMFPIIIGIGVVMTVINVLFGRRGGRI